MISIVTLLICVTPPENTADGVAILNQRCVRCHNADKTRGGLDLSTRETALAGGATTDAIVPGDPEKSAVYLRAKEHSMPPPKDAPPLSDAEVNTLGRWINAGAPWSASNQPADRSHQHSPTPPESAISNPQSAICAVDSKTRRLRRWRRHGNVVAPLPQIALRPRRR